MPRQSDLELFKRDLSALSGEDEVLKEWGERREEIPLPELEAAAPPRPSASRGAARPEEPAMDFSDLLDNLPLGGADEGKAGAPSARAPSGPVDDDELAALLGAGLEDLEAGAESAEAAFPEEAAAEPEFDVPTEALGEPSAKAAAEAVAETEPELGALLEAGFAEEEPQAPAEEAFSLPELGDLGGPASLDELGELGEAAAPAAEGAGAEAPFSLDDFTLPDFGAPEAGGEVGAEAEAVPAAGAEAWPGGEAEEAPPAEPLEEFEELEEAAPEEAPAEASAGASAEAGAEGGIPSIDDFSIPDFEIPEAPGGGEAAAPTASEWEMSPESLPEGSAAAAQETAPAGESGLEELGSLDLGGDSFEAFSFEGGGAAAAPSSEALDRELASLGEGSLEDATFSLDSGWGAGFEEPGAAPAAPQRPAPGRGGRAGAPPQGPAARPRAERPRAAPEEKVREVSLSEAQVDRLQDVLLALPLNVRVAVETVVATEQGTEAQRSRLVWMLVEGARAEEIANLAGRVLKRRVAVPPGFEKSTGAAFEAEKGSLRYILVKTILPVARTALLVLAAAGALGWLGWRYVYRPLAANALYRQGYALVAKDRYQDAEEAFRRAGEIRRFKNWYYRYAEAYAARTQDIRAERKYEQLLELWPGELKGALDWARLEIRQAKYEKAVEVLQKRILDRRESYLQKDALLLLADTYLAWAEEERGGKRDGLLEEARRNAAALVQTYGSQDEYEERMLLYFIRSGDLKSVLPLADRFLNNEKAKVRAATLAELGGFLFDEGDAERVRPVLMKAAELDPKVPETHYQLARYFRAISSKDEERRALENAVKTFRALLSMDRRQLGHFIDALVRRGRFLSERGEWVAAEQDYADAAAAYEQGLTLGRLDRLPVYAAAYAGLAEVAYLRRDDMAASLRLFERAAEDGFDDARSRYRRGYALYRLERPGEALEQFWRAGIEGGESPYLLYAFANALSARRDWLAAEGYYRRVIAMMKAEMDRRGEIEPQRIAAEGEIIELLTKATNNLGVALYHGGTRLGDPRRRTQAMENFAESARLSDSLTRDQATMERSASQNLGFLNIDKILHPVRGYELGGYADLERDMDWPRS